MPRKKPPAHSRVEALRSEAAAASPESTGSPYGAHHVHAADALVRDAVAAAGTPDAEALASPDVDTPEFVAMMAAARGEEGVGASSGSVEAAAAPAAAITPDTPDVAAANNVGENDIRSNNDHVRRLFDGGSPEPGTGGRRR